jgi:hypothetical protein
MNSTISTPFPSKKTVAIRFWQADNVCLKIFGFFGECMRIHCFDFSLVSTFTNKTHVTSSVTLAMLLRNSSPSLCYRSKKSKPKPFSAFCEHQ